MTQGFDRVRNWIPRIEGIFRAVLADDGISLTSATRKSEVPGWNRATHLDIIAALEKAFGIRFMTSEVWKTAQIDATVGDILEILSRKSSESVKNLHDSLASAASPSLRRRLLENNICEHLAAVLGLPVGAIDRGRVFQDLGVTSLMVIELCTRLEMSLGVRVSPTLAYDYPSTERLCSVFEHQLGFELDK